VNNNYVKYTAIPELLPLHPGDELIIASDLTKLAFLARRKEGDFSIPLFMQAFKTKLGNSSTLLVPAYNHDLKDGDRYNPGKTLPVTGSLASGLLNDPSFKRTANPLHSFLVWGKNSAFYTSLNNTSSFGGNSPFAFFGEHKAIMLCIATGVADALTYVHYFEEKYRVPYRTYRKLKIHVQSDIPGTDVREYLLYAKKKGWTMNLPALEQKFRQEGLITETLINNIRFQMVDINRASRIIESDIKENRAGSIARFDYTLFLKEHVKAYLYKLNFYKSKGDRIRKYTGLF